MNHHPTPAGSRFRHRPGARAVGLIVLVALVIGGGVSAAGKLSTPLAVARTVLTGTVTAIVTASPTVLAEPTRTRPAPGRPAREPPAVDDEPQPMTPEPPVELAPVEPAPVEPAPVEPAPVELASPAPVRLTIDAIGVDTDLVGLGLQHDGTLEVPPGAFPAGWYRGGPTPGELGPAVIVGHVDWSGAAGVFADLDRIRVGDEVAVMRADGTTATFVITKTQRVAKRDFPTAAVYGDLDHAGLRLITCGGVFDRNAASYEDNIIAFAELRRLDG